jgi:hypothetical protein
MRPWKIPAFGSDFKKQFTVLDLGFPLRSGWLTESLRAALARFYSLELSLDRLSLEAGRLIHRSRLPLRRIDATILRELLARQAAVAAEFEDSL